MVPCFFTSSAIDLFQVVLEFGVCLFFLFPCGFESKACLVTLLVCFRRVCPIHVHFLLAISPDAVLVCPPPDFFVCGFICHLVFRIYLRHLLINVCNFQVIVFVALHVSEPYSSTFFTLVLKILILFRVAKDAEFITVYKMLNACLAFPILFLTSSYVPPLSVTSLPR